MNFKREKCKKIQLIFINIGHDARQKKLPFWKKPFRNFRDEKRETEAVPEE